MQKPLRGTMVVMITPFTSSETIDETGVRQNIDWYIDQGIHGIICNGSTGEFALMNEDEQKRLIALTVEHVNGRVPVMAGTSAMTTKAALAMTQYAQQVGVDAAMVVSPYYGSPSDADVLAHFSTVLTSTSLPIMLYNNPGYSGYDMPVDVVVKLSKFENAHYIKESSGDIRRIHDIQRRAGQCIIPWCGWEDLALEAMFMGCGGWVSPTANFLPALCAQLFDLVAAQKADEAKALYHRLLVFLEYLEGGQLLAKTKAAMDFLGLAGGNPRMPFVPLTATQKQELKVQLQQIGAL